MANCSIDNCINYISPTQEKTTISLYGKPYCKDHEIQANIDAKKETEALMTPRAKVLALLARRGFEEQSVPGFFILDSGATKIAVDLNHQVTFPGIPVIGVLQPNSDIVEEGHGIQRIDDLRQEIEGILKSKSKTLQSSSIENALRRDLQNPDLRLSARVGNVEKNKLGTHGTLTKEVKDDTARQSTKRQDDKNILSATPVIQKTEVKGGQESPQPKGNVIKTCSVCGFELSGQRALECFQKDLSFQHEECTSIVEDVKKKHGLGHTKKSDARIPVQAHTPQGSIIKGFQPSLKEIGKIKIGGKGEERPKAGGGTYRLPVKYDHFEIVSLMRDEDGNLISDPIMKELGEAPKELDCMLLFNDPTLNFVTRYNQYQGGKCLCQGDGEMAKQADGTKIECNPETCQTFISKKCKPNGILSVILTKSPRLGGVYKFRTTSFNSIRSILSSMFSLSNLTGGILSMIPLKLTVSPMQVQPKDSTKVQTIYVVNIEFSGTAPELLQKTFEVQQYQSNMRENIIKLESKARAVLTAPESKEEIKDIEAEFYIESQKE